MQFNESACRVTLGFVLKINEETKMTCMKRHIYSFVTVDDANEEKLDEVLCEVTGAFQVVNVKSERTIYCLLEQVECAM